MKKYAGIVISLLFAIWTYGDPPSCDVYWDGEDETPFWKDAGNWSSNTVPNNTQVVCITGGVEVVIWYSASIPAQAKAIYVDSNSEVEIYGDNSLILCGGSNCVTSQVDGTLEIYNGVSILKIGQDVTINGSGTVELSLEGGSTGVGKIQASSGSPTLTLGSGLTLKGFGDIDVAVVNNGHIEAELGDLNFNGSLTLNGTMTVAPNGTAYLTQNLTVPSGAFIQLETSGENRSKLKPKSGFSPTLTVSSGGTIKGAGELHFALTNNGTVAARNGTLDLKLGGSGTGKWTAETSTGRLLVSSEVTGSGLWELVDHAGAKIEIDAPTECLTGNVNVLVGMLDIDAKFHTTGQLWMHGQDSLIDVAATKSAKFNLQSPPSCSSPGGGPE